MRQRRRSGFVGIANNAARWLKVGGLGRLKHCHRSGGDSPHVRTMRNKLDLLKQLCAHVPAALAGPAPGAGTTKAVVVMIAVGRRNG